MTTSTFPFGLQPVYFTDANGLPLAGGNVYVYYTGTLNAAPTWGDADATANNTFPIELDGSGRGYIWGDSSLSYDIIWQNANTGQNVSTVNFGVGSGLLNGAVTITGEQTVTGLKTFSGGVGFGQGNSTEYADGILDAVFGSTTQAVGGFEIIGSRTANISMANNEGTVDGGFGYNVVTKTLTIFSGGQDVADITQNSVAFPLAATFTANGQAFLTNASIIQISGGGTGQTDSANALLALVPPVTGNSGNALLTDGTIIKWGTTAGVINIIEPPYQFFNGTSEVSWTTFNVAAAGVATTATKVLIQIVGTNLGPGPGGITQYFVCGRANTSVGNTPQHPENDAIVIGAVDCQSPSNVEGSSCAGQAWIPLRAGRLFDFIAPTYSGKSWQALSLKIVGYA